MSNRFPFETAVIAGGGGAVGALLAHTLAAAGTRSLTLIDPRAQSPAVPGFRVLPDDVTHPSHEALRLISAADLVILALPEAAAHAAARQVLAHLKPDSLLVDTLSVKSRFALTLQSVPTAAELLGINPMFAPALGFRGRSLIAVPYAGARLAEAFLDCLAAQDCRVTRMGAEQHDLACASLQVATHAAVLGFGMALHASGVDAASLEAVMPPPHRTLLALLARVVSGEPEVYRDIQAANPFAAPMRARLLEAQRELQNIVDSDSADRFDALIMELRTVVAGTETDFATLCARLFAVE